MSITTEFNDFMPTEINTTDSIYTAFFGDAEVFPAYITDPVTGQNTYLYGALSNELETLQDFITQVTTQIDIEDFTDRFLEILVKLFTGFTRQYNEADSNMRTELFAVLRRGREASEDETQFDYWDTEFSMLNVVGQFLPRDNIYTEPILGGDNLVTSPYFNEDNSDWIYKVSDVVTPLVTISVGAFQDGTSVVLAPDSTIQQTVVAAEIATFFYGGYFSPVTYTDPLSIQFAVQRSDTGDWYNTSTLTWESSETWNNQYVTQQNWGYMESFCELEATTSLTVIFKNNSGVVMHFDRVLVAKRLTYPSVNLLARADSIGVKPAWGLEGTTDPVASVDYDNNVAYLDNSYLSLSIGSSTLYDDLVEIVKLAGCKVTMETIVAE